MQMQETKTINVRGIDKSLWQQFRSITLVKGLTVSAALQDAIRLWLKLQQGRIP